MISLHRQLKLRQNNGASCEAPWCFDGGRDHRPLKLLMPRSAAKAAPKKRGLLRGPVVFSMADGITVR
jgi:hypothetical protein